MNRIDRKGLHGPMCVEASGSSAEAAGEAQPKDKSCRRCSRSHSGEDCRLQRGVHRPHVRLRSRCGLEARQNALPPRAFQKLDSKLKLVSSHPFCRFVPTFQMYLFCLCSKLYTNPLKLIEHVRGARDVKVDARGSRRRVSILLSLHKQ